MDRIDLNSDLGENFGAWRMGDDAAMLSIVSSANIACGFHAGDPAGLLRTLTAAAERGVAIGAHVSYPDKVGFGRRAMDVSTDELIADTLYQIGALTGLAAVAGTTVTYVKPHGALYNTTAIDPRQGAALVEALLKMDDPLTLMTLAGAPLARIAREAGLDVVEEAFADRAYTANGELVSRREPGAVLHDPEIIAQRMLTLVCDGEIEAVDGTRLRLDAQSICVHGDSPGSVAIAKRVSDGLRAAGVSITAFSR